MHKEREKVNVNVTEGGVVLRRFYSKGIDQMMST